jgi:hypothetical protein
MYLLSVSENSDEFRGKARVLHQVIKGGGPTRVTQSSCPTNPAKKGNQVIKECSSDEKKQFLMSLFRIAFVPYPLSSLERFQLGSVPDPDPKVFGLSESESLISSIL